jgi:hypothetical protein
MDQATEITELEDMKVSLWNVFYKGSEKKHVRQNIECSLLLFLNEHSLGVVWITRMLKDTGKWLLVSVNPPFGR